MTYNNMHRVMKCLEEKYTEIGSEWTLNNAHSKPIVILRFSIFLEYCFAGIDRKARINDHLHCNICYAANSI